VACMGILVNCIMGGILFQGGHHSHGLHGNDPGHDEADHHRSSHSNEKKSDENPDVDEKMKADKRNINVRSAFVHVLGDFVQSIGVVIAAALIWYDHNLRMLDPVCTLIFSVIVVFTTTTLIKDALDVLMENVPRHINLDKVVELFLQLPDVAGVHDLHVWNLSMGKAALSVHLLAKASTVDNSGKVVPACADGILRKAQKLCSAEFDIHHSTIQIEYPRAQHTQGTEISCPSYCEENAQRQDAKKSNELKHKHEYEHEHKHKHEYEHEHEHKQGDEHTHEHELEHRHKYKHEHQHEVELEHVKNDTTHEDVNIHMNNDNENVETTKQKINKKKRNEH